jgi:hypothetical protein
MTKENMISFKEIHVKITEKYVVNDTIFHKALQINIFG